MMKKVILLVCLLITIVLFTGCANTVDLEDTSESETVNQEDVVEESEPEEDDIKIGVIFTTQGLGDNNFSDMIYEGLVKARDNLGIPFDYSEPTTAGEIINLLYEYANDGSYDLIIVATSDAASSLAEVAPKYPDQRFTIIDTAVDEPNVRSVFKKGAEQTFMAGVVAALLTQESDFEYINEEKVIGQIIGMHNPVVNAMAAGFAAGAYYADPEVEVLFSEVGSWSDPGTAKEMSLAMFDQGADIIQHIAGGSGTGIFAAAEEVGALAIGVGNNMNSMSTHVIGTASFNLEEYVYDEARQLKDGEWTGGIVNPGLEIGALGFETEGSSITLPSHVLEAAENAKNWVIEDNIDLPTDPAQVEAWGEENISN
jgi:basic membrane protein A